MAGVFICWQFCQACSTAAAGLIIEIDYSYDTSGFFQSPQRRETLANAFDSVNRWVDTLSPIAQSGGNTWTGVVIRPDTGIGTFLDGSGLSIPADTIRVYVGARNLGANFLASAERNFALSNGTPAWNDLVRYRGQAGTAQNADYSPWGGAISFNPNFAWHDGIDANGLEPTEYDLFTVASHEMVHLLGFGTAESFNALILDGKFTGPAAVAQSSAANPLLVISADGDHWEPQTNSTIAGQSVLSLLTPSIPPGQRLRMSDLDAAALDDLGWEPALAGDLDRDRDVDFNDMFTLVNEYGAVNAGWSQGDSNGDGLVDFTDAFEAVNNYGAGGAGAQASKDWPAEFAAVVPEPDLLPLGFIFALAAMLFSALRHKTSRVFGVQTSGR